MFSFLGSFICSVALFFFVFFVCVCVCVCVSVFGFAFTISLGVLFVQVFFSFPSVPRGLQGLRALDKVWA